MVAFYKYIIIFISQALSNNHRVAASLLQKMNIQQINNVCCYVVVHLTFVPEFIVYPSLFSYENIYRYRFHASLIGWCACVSCFKPFKFTCKRKCFLRPCSCIFKNYKAAINNALAEMHKLLQSKFLFSFLHNV